MSSALTKSSSLLTDLQRLLKRLEDDLRSRSDSDPAIAARLKAQYEAARKSGRTAAAYGPWRDERVTQSAVGWLLACVFLRFLEDNDFLDAPLLSGPGPRLALARDPHEAYFRTHPLHSDRDYLEHTFRSLAALPTLGPLLGERHNPLWQITPSGDMAAALLAFFQKVDPDSGHLVHDFTDPDADTRFLGDLYQDLSESARKRFALLQTPDFVQEFILDRTLEPAIAAFGLAGLRLIDPTAGSGHFLLGAFHRILERWRREEPGTPIRDLAQRTLDSVFGVDLNPFAVAIARFRLLLATLRACDIAKLRHAPAFRIHLATGDALLHGRRFRQYEADAAGQRTFDTGEDAFRDELKHHFEVEDPDALHRILGQQYHAVVGNPPYIAVQDRALKAAYKDRYPSCAGKWVLVVPFLERFFDLTLKPDPTSRQPAGFMGQITGNNFMKREFGKTLIEKFLPKWDLTHVIDNSGAYIPGHGTPTVLLFGRNQPPVSPTIRTVLGIRGEPSTPANPALGFVWQAILDQVDQPGSSSEWVSASDSDRSKFHKHPWSIGGGGAAELKELLEESCQTSLVQASTEIGISSVTGEDDLYVFPARRDIRRLRIEQSQPLATGDLVRDWMLPELPEALWVYDHLLGLLSLDTVPLTKQFLWSFRAAISRRKRFGTPMIARGLAWYEWQELYAAKFKLPLTITWGEVATHNHFVLDRGGKVFKQTAPVIKLKPEATEADHIRLLGTLNSSSACFWLKQVCHNKGSTVDEHGARQRTAPFEDFFALNATKVANLPIPSQQPTHLPARLVASAEAQQKQSPGAILDAWAGVAGGDLRALLASGRDAWHRARRQSIAWQEELDWQVYESFQLIASSDALSLPEGSEEIPVEGLELGQRAFEIVLARRMAAGEVQSTWFERHGSVPITEPPSHWPAAYRARVERRIQRIADDANIRLIEQPEYKRRWNTEPWDSQREKAGAAWLLARLEGFFFEGQRVCELRDGFNPVHPGFPAASGPALVSVTQLADVAAQDAAFMTVAGIHTDAPGFSVPKLVRSLVEAESAPILPVQRYKESGLRNRRVWEEVWDLQRREDAIDEAEGVDAPGISPIENEARRTRAKDRKAREIGDIPVPPKYSQKDFKAGSVWSLRGKLDVPKERWVSFPGAEKDTDPGLVIAWAGWNHLQQAQALAAYLEDLKAAGAPESQQLLLLAGLGQLIPWLRQWHNELDPALGLRLGDYFQSYLEDELRRLGRTQAELQGIAYGTQVDPMVL